MAVMLTREAANTAYRPFFGSHPRSAQVPPNGCLSIMATLHPALRHREATVLAAEPDPITMRSNERGFRGDMG